MRFYLPLAQRAGQRTGRADTIVVRTRPEATATVITTMRSLVTTARPPTIEIVTDRIRRALHPWRTAALLFTALGAIALILACVGIYSVMSYLVAERLHEMGLRMALGATGADVLRLILGNGLRLIGLGAALGLLAAASFAHLLQSLLYGVSSREPLVYTGAAACLIVLSTAAMLPAAVRAARVDPVDTLRTD
jgi:ABC-type antimicrobial peptide transport system permease subunit